MILESYSSDRVGTDLRAVRSGASLKQRTPRSPPYLVSVPPAVMADFFFNLPPILQGLLKGLAVIMVIFPIAGICSMAERKVAAWVQDRPGPNRAIVPWVAWIPFVGRFLQRLGLFHVMADGGKMLFKEDSLPNHVNKFYFVLAPIIAMIPALTTVTAVPFGAYLAATGKVIPIGLAPIDIGILAVFAVSSLGVYSLILAGWASNSKYPFLGKRARLGAAHFLRTLDDAGGFAGVSLGQRAGYGRHDGIRASGRISEPAGLQRAAYGLGS